MAILSFLGRGSNSGLDLVRLSRARKAATETRLKMYYDQQAEDLAELIRVKWSSPEQFRLFFVNIVRKVVDKRAMVYAARPFRVFEGMDQARGEALYAAMGADIVLKKANRLTKLCKTTALRVGWQGDRPTLSVITPNVLDVELDGDPEWPMRWIVTHPGQRETDTTYAEWTDGTHLVFNHAGGEIQNPENPGNLNPYGMAPLVPLFDRAPDDCFFLPGGDDLVEAQRAVNIGLVNLWRAIELQSHGQAWASGLPAGDVLRAGPDRTINLPENGKFGFAAPETPVENVLRALEFVIKQTAVANDLAANVFEIDPKAESGAAKLAEQRDLLEARADDIELWRGYEARLFETVKTVVNVHAPGTIPEGATLRIDFGELDETGDDAARLDGYQRRIDMGLWSPVDALMADNPDIRTREDALRILQQRREEAAVLGAAFASPGFPETDQ